MGSYSNNFGQLLGLPAGVDPNDLIIEEGPYKLKRKGLTLLPLPANFVRKDPTPIPNAPIEKRIKLTPLGQDSGFVDTQGNSPNPDSGFRVTEDRGGMGGLIGKGYAIGTVPSHAVPEQVLSSVLNENKGFSSVFSPENTQIILGSPERRSLLKRTGRGDRRLEYWDPETESWVDQQSPHDTVTRPGPLGKHILEIYHPELMADSQKLKQAVYGDLLHGMTRDPYFANLREQFKQNYLPARRAYEESRGWGGPGGEDSIHDMYIRGWISPDERDEFRKFQSQYGTVYSPRQIQILKAMQDYIKTGKRGSI